MIRLICAAVLLTLAGACGTDSDRDRELVRDARDRLFAAISGSDSASIRAACAPDYVLIEGGPIWDVDSLLKAVHEMKRSGLQIAYSFESDSIWLEGPVAWMTYHNQGILSGARGADTLQWVESAVFRKQGDTWRMVLLHSTGLQRKL